MITEQYVSFEVAKLLKEKGFPQNPHNINFNVYVIRDIDDPDKGKWNAGYMFFSNDSYATCLDKNSLAIAPSQSVVMRWLREVYNLYFELIPFFEDRVVYYDYNILQQAYRLPFLYDGELQVMHCDDSIDGLSYEEAIEAAIKYCLENLI